MPMGMPPTLARHGGSRWWRDATIATGCREGGALPASGGSTAACGMRVECSPAPPTHRGTLVCKTNSK